MGAAGRKTKSVYNLLIRVYWPTIHSKEWQDERLTWDPVDFGNLTDIIVRADKLWLPELAVMNGAEELMPDFDRIRVLLHSDGRIHWEPGGIFKTTCDIDIGHFPFDTQHCPMLIGAYSYYSNRMNITNASSVVSTHDFSLNGEWHVSGTEAEWAITYLDAAGERGYSHVIFTLHLKRRYKFYVMNIVLPCVMLSVLILIGFCLPPDAGEKISLGISVLLAFTVFLLMIADSIPRTSSAIPLIVTYLMATMTLGTLSICMTVVILNVHHRGTSARIPLWLRRVAFVYVARLLCVKTPYAYDDNSKHGQQTASSASVNVDLSPPPSPIEPIWKRRSDARPPSPPAAKVPELPRACVRREGLELTLLRMFRRSERPPTDTPTCNGSCSLVADGSVIASTPTPPRVRRPRVNGTSQTKTRRTNVSRDDPVSSADTTTVKDEVLSPLLKAPRPSLTARRHSAARRRLDIARHSRSESAAWSTIDSGESPAPCSADDDDDMAEQYANEWRELARILDRLCFWILLVLMTGSGFIILLYPKYTGSESDWGTGIT